MNFDDVKRDCKFFKGHIPCEPNKTSGQICISCNQYQAIETRVLIIKLGALGDVIRTTPLLSMFRTKFPNAHISWLTLSPEILPKKEIDEIFKLDGVSLFKLENTIFDVVFNLDKDQEACVLMSKISAAHKYGFTWENHAVAPCDYQAEHKLMTGFFDQLSKENKQSYLQEIFSICHEEFNGETYSIQLNAAYSEKWLQVMSELKEDKKVVGLNTGCGPRWNTRLWKDDYWVALAQLLKSQGFFPVFLGGELEHERNLTMAKKAGVHYPGHFDLENFIALTNACDLVVTQVTMMMHIATALQKKLILMNTIFNPYEFELYGRGVLVGPPKPCDCYFGNTCKHDEPCMLSIMPESILDAVLSIA